MQRATPQDRARAASARDLLQRRPLPHAASDAAAHDVLLCIGTGATVTDPDRLQVRHAGVLPQDRRGDGSASSPAFIPTSIEHTLESPSAATSSWSSAARPCLARPARRCDSAPSISSALGGRTAAADTTAPRLLRDRTLAVRDGDHREDGFAQYFLIVRDFAQFAAEKGIYYGVRGSAAGVHRLLPASDITDIDPVEYGLTFERFLNPERVQMPDVDMDFEDTPQGRGDRLCHQQIQPTAIRPRASRRSSPSGRCGARAVLQRRRARAGNAAAARSTSSAR